MNIILTRRPPEAILKTQLENNPENYAQIVCQKKFVCRWIAPFLGIGKALADGDGYSSKKRVLAYEFFTVTAGESIDFTSPGEDPPTTGQLIAAEDKGMTLVLEGLLDKTFGQLTKEQWGWVDKQAQRIDQWDEMTNSPQFNLTYLGNDQ